MDNEIRSEVIIVAESIKAARKQYLTDMDNYILKIKKMPASDRHIYAHESLRQSGIITKSGKLTKHYKQG